MRFKGSIRYHIQLINQTTVGEQNQREVYTVTQTKMQQIIESLHLKSSGKICPWHLLK